MVATGRFALLFVVACGEAPTGELLCPPGTTSTKDGCTSTKPGPTDAGPKRDGGPNPMLEPARVRPTEIDFGLAGPGQVVSRFFDVENPNRVGSVVVAIREPENRAFRLGPGVPSGNVELGPREELSVHVVFDPERPGFYESEIEVACGAGCTVKVLLAGYSEVLPLTCPTLDFGVVDVGTCLNGLVQCRNPNLVPLTWAVSLFGDPAFLFGSVPGSVLPPGAAPPIEVLFCPTIDGTFFGSLELDLFTDDGLVIPSYASLSGRTPGPPPPPPPPPPPMGAVMCGTTAFTFGPTLVGNTDLWSFICSATNGQALVEKAQISPPITGATVRAIATDGMAPVEIPPPRIVTNMLVEVTFAPTQPGTVSTTIEIVTAGGTTIVNLTLIAE
jgi:hypothetical protein